MEKTELKSKAGLRREETDPVYRLMLEGKREIAAICGAMPLEGGKSPVQRLAKYWNDHPSTAPARLEEVFSGFLDEQREHQSKKYYCELIGEVKKNLLRQVRALAQAEEGPLNEKWVEAYLQTIGENPLGDRLKEVLAGLPPVDQTAKTNLGLPTPEDHGDKFQEFFCPQPFEYAQTDPLGRLFLCCPQTLPEPAGSLFENDFMEVWNSERAQEIRRSVLDGSFRYCSESTCGVLQQRRLPKKTEVKNPYHRTIIEHGVTRLEKGPDTINMSHDRSCNLACPSCRTDFIILKGKAKQRAERIQERLTDPGHLKDAKRLIITGSGDPFGSRLYHSFLRTYRPEMNPRLRITLSTNGLLLNEKSWNTICSEAVDRVELSVDGASQQSYAANRGGDFTTLVNNLHFIGDLRKRGELKAFELHYVVQKNNFWEMKDFIELGRKVHADVIAFKQLVNWGTYSENEYINRAVQLPSHPLHGVFRNLLQDPVFRSPGVYMHDLSFLIPAVPASQTV